MPQGLRVRVPPCPQKDPESRYFQGLDFYMHVCYTIYMFKTNKNLIFLGVGILAILLVILLSTTKAASAQVYSDGYAHLSEYTNPNPAVTGLFPASNNSGNITIKGFGFIPTSIVRVNGMDHPSKFIDSKNLIINLSMNQISGTDPVYISVFNEGPGGGYSNASSIKVDKVYTNYNPNTNTSNTNNYSNQNGYNNTGSNGTSYNTNNYGNYQGGNGQNGSNGSNDTNGASSLASNALFGSNSSGLSIVPSGLIGWVMFAIVILLMIIVVRRIFGFTDNYHAAPLKHD